MANKIDKNMSILPSGFTSFSNLEEDSEENTAVGRFLNSEKKKKGSRGRPLKEGLKNAQFTLTMNPEKYEKFKVIADEYTRGNFSALVDQALSLYCKREDIDLQAIEIAPEVLEKYYKKQSRKK